MEAIQPEPPLFEERWEHRGYVIVRKKYASKGDTDAYQLLGKHDGFGREQLLSCSSLGRCIKHLNEMTLEISK